MATPTPAPGLSPEQPIRLVPPVEESVRRPLAGDPSLVGLPSFIVGAVAFGMVLIGVTPVGAVGAALPIILTASPNLTKAAGWVTLGFTAVAVYLFLSSAFHATGGKEFPLGKPLLRA